MGFDVYGVKPKENTKLPKWIVDLETNKFVMFPATLEYYIENKNNSYLNYIQTLTYVDVGDVTY